MTEILVADCVARSFGGHRVLTSASLRAVAGEFRALLGGNGAGKSTLLKIACGMLAPDTGIVRIDGRRYQRAALATLARSGVFYWPEANLLSSAFPVGRQLEMIRRAFDGADVREVAEQVQITPLLGLHPDRLSGGEKRRAELAAMLVRRPRCLLADEPCRGVDPIDVERLTRQFTRLARDGMAIVVTGHEVPTLLASADHVTWCTSGTTYELGPPEAARMNDAFRRDYLGPAVQRAVVPPRPVVSVQSE